jgi:phage-related holin
MRNIWNAIALFLTPVIPMLAVCFMIIIIDTITGRKAAKKNKEEITSRKFRLGFVSKVITYFAVILMAYFTDYFILNEITRNYVWFDYLFTRFWVGVLIYIEWTSINENIKVIRGFSINEKAGQLIKGVKEVIKELMTIKQQ